MCKIFSFSIYLLQGGRKLPICAFVILLLLRAFAGLLHLRELGKGTASPAGARRPAILLAVGSARDRFQSCSSAENFTAARLLSGVGPDPASQANTLQAFQRRLQQLWPSVYNQAGASQPRPHRGYLKNATQIWLGVLQGSWAMFPSHGRMIKRLNFAEHFNRLLRQVNSAPPFYSAYSEVHKGYSCQKQGPSKGIWE